MTFLLYIIAFFFPVSPTVIYVTLKFKEKSILQKIILIIFTLQTIMAIFVLKDLFKPTLYDIATMVFTIFISNIAFYFLFKLAIKFDLIFFSKKGFNQINKDIEETKIPNDSNDKNNSIKFYRNLGIVIIVLLIIGAGGTFLENPNKYFNNSNETPKLISSIKEQSKLIQKKEKINKNSTTEVTNKNNIDINQMEVSFTKQGFTKKVIPPNETFSDTIISFQKEVDKFDQFIDFYIDKNQNLIKISIISQQFHVSPNLLSIKRNLEEIITIIKTGINDDELVAQLSSIIENFPVKAPEKAEDAEYNYYETSNFEITTFNNRMAKNIDIERK